VTPDPPQSKTRRWEFYFGGMFGLTVGLALQVYDLTTAAGARPIPSLGAVAAARTVVWFAAFALFDDLSMSGTARRLALGVGLAGVVVFGVGSDALVWPALTQPFWAAAALMLPAVVVSSAWAQSGPGRLLPVVLAAALLGLFVQQVYWPATRGAALLRDARHAARQAPYFLKQVRDARDAEKPFRRGQAVDFVKRLVSTPLRQAVDANPGDITPWLEQSDALATLWELSAQGDEAGEALVSAAVASALDPEGTAGPRAELQLCLRFAAQAASNWETQFREAERLIRMILERDPTVAARLRFQVAEAYRKIAQKKKDDAPRKLKNAERKLKTPKRPRNRRNRLRRTLRPRNSWWTRRGRNPTWCGIWRRPHDDRVRRPGRWTPRHRGRSTDSLRRSASKFRSGW
jgi:hypothetical protein